MTYDEWLKTERQHNDITKVESAFGYVPEGPGRAVQAVVSFDPGTAVILEGGDWYTHIDRCEYRGTADEVRQCLWEKYAKSEGRG